MAQENKDQPLASANANLPVIKKRELKWDSKSNEEGLLELANHLFGIQATENEDGFMDINYNDNYNDEEIKVFMKVLKSLVEHGELRKIQHMNMVRDGKIIQSDEKASSFCSGLTHMNKYAYPTFSKKYTDWLVRKKNDKMFEERIQKIAIENEKLKRKLREKEKNKPARENNNLSSSSSSDTSDSETSKKKPKKKHDNVNL